MDLMLQMTLLTLGKVVVVVLTLMAMEWPFAMDHQENYQRQQLFTSP